MVKTPQYSVLLNARRFLVGRAKVEGNQAHLLLSVVDENNDLVLFRCFLSKQSSAEYKDCWMTDAVIRLETARQHLKTKPASSAI
jgi:hypothetical protein